MVVVPAAGAKLVVRVGVLLVIHNKYYVSAGQFCNVGVGEKRNYTFVLMPLSPQNIFVIIADNQRLENVGIILYKGCIYGFTEKC